MRALLPHNVEDRNLEAGPGQTDLSPTHIGLEKQSEVCGAQLRGEVVSVEAGEATPLLGHGPEMMPDQKVEDRVRD